MLVALVASVAAFGVGMFTLDSFSFTQVTFVFFVILGLGSALVLAPDPVPAPSFETSPAPRVSRSNPRGSATGTVCGVRGSRRACGRALVGRRRRDGASRSDPGPRSWPRRSPHAPPSSPTRALIAWRGPCEDSEALRRRNGKRVQDGPPLSSWARWSRCSQRWASPGLSRFRRPETTRRCAPPRSLAITRLRECERGLPGCRRSTAGSAYYGQFSNPLPTQLRTFRSGCGAPTTRRREPQPRRRGWDQHLRLGGDPSYLAGDPCRPAVPGDPGRGHSRESAPKPRGWLLHDEIDMTQGPGACPGAVNAIKDGLPNDGRFPTRTTGRAS